MPILVIDIVKPKNAGDFPITEDIDTLGGFQTVGTVAERDAITTAHRKEGMRVRVFNEPRSYELQGGLTNSDWVEVEVPTATETAMTIPVDYNDVGAVDPPADLKFWKQSQIDSFLTDNAATNFRHYQLARDAVVGSVGHAITFSVAAGVHRPVPAPPGAAFQLADKQITTGGYIQTIGPVPSLWDGQAGVSGLTVDSFTAPTSNDPSLAFTTSHPLVFAGLDLTGGHVTTSTGQALTIISHTDDVLFVSGAVSGAPTTASIARPSAIFRASLDDAVVTGANTMFAYSLSGPKSAPRGGHEEWQNIRFDNFGLGAVFLSGGDVTFQDCLVDYEEQRSAFGVAAGGRAFQHGGGADSGFDLLGVGIRNAPGVGNAGAPVFTNSQGNSVDMENCSFYGAQFGVAISNCTLFQMINSSISNCGVSTGFALQLDNTTFWLADRTFFLQGCNPRIEGYRLELLNGSRTFFNFFTRAILGGIVGTPAVYVSGAGIDFSAADPGGFVQGANANTDVGVEVPTSSRRGTLELNASTNVTGTAGDARFNGVVETYAAVSAGPLTDVPFNLIDKA